VDQPIKNSTAFNFQDYTILIVDDTPTNLGVIADYLKTYGFRIRMTRSGEKALKRVKYAPPDIILLDVMMPGIDGFETCRRLKADETSRDIPVIFMTALVNPDDKVKGFKVGAVDYVTKPLHQEEVLARVTTHLQIRDLTRSLQKSNQELAASNQELAALNATKDKFFSIVAHDLRGPFQPLLGTSEVFLTMADTIPRSEIKKLGEGMYHTLKGVYDLLENLLNWSQIEQGRIEYLPDGIDLRRITKPIINLFTENAADKDIRLQNNVIEGVFVYADKNMLDMVIRNLISNALKFTPNGGQITISAGPGQPSSEFVEVSISDSGVGISQADLNKLFKLGVHHTTPGTAREKGTGLGLILCQEMVEKNGGQIWLESELGQGTTVKFTMLLDKSNPIIISWPEKDGAKTTAVAETIADESAKMEKELLVPPSQDTLTVLTELARRGNMIGLGQQADQLEARDEQLAPFAYKLRHLAKNFEDEQILALIKQYIEQEQ